VEKHQSNTLQTEKKSSREIKQEQRHLKRNGAKALFGDKCHDCGYDERWEVLEFHHIEPRADTGKKKLNQMLGWKWERLRDELLESCVLLCPTCHKIRHMDEEEKFRSETDF
jgi:hypothetical protein